MTDEEKGKSKEAKPVHGTNKSSCYERRHMTMQEYGVYCYIRQVSHRTKIFYLDGRRLAEEFEGASKDTAYRVINRLKKKGWLEETRPAKRLKNGMFANGQYRPLGHDEWVQRHPDSCRLPNTKERAASCTKENDPVVHPGPVSAAQSTIPNCANDHSRPCDRPFATVQTTIRTDETKVSKGLMVGKDSREGQYNNISTRIYDKQKDDVADVDVVTAGNPLPPSSSSPKAPVTEEVSEDLLLRKVRKIFREQGAPYKRPRPKHVELAKQRVSEYGFQAFLVGLNYWLEAPETVDELTIGAKKDGTLVLKSWLLFEFCGTAVPDWRRWRLRGVTRGRPVVTP
jgi:transposase